MASLRTRGGGLDMQVAILGSVVVFSDFVHLLALWH